MQNETLSGSSASRTPPLTARDWLVATVLGRWYVVALFASFGAVAGFFSSYLMEPIYRAETVLVSVQTNGSGLGSLIGGGGLAALAGIELPQINDNNADAAIATLGSRNLATRLIESRNLLPSLFADQWDATSGRWKDDAPTLNEALQLFAERIRTIRRESGTVRLGIDWRDPAAAADWANTLVSMANEVIREREITEADRTILALSAEVDRASSVEVRAALYDLIEAQLKSKSAAAGREQFAFRVIDAAVAPDSDKPIWPRRSLLAALGLLMGGCVGIATALRIASRRNGA